MKIQMLVLLAAMVRTNFAIQGSKRLIIDRCTLIVAFALSNLQCHPKKMCPFFGSVLKPMARMNANESLTRLRV